MNPSLCTNPLYLYSPQPPLGNTDRLDVYLPEFHRISVSRLRLVAHNLKVETGRWAHLPPEQRLCPCNSIQTEEQVVCHCPLTLPIRMSHPNVIFTFPAFFDSPPSIICQIVHNLSIYL